MLLFFFFEDHCLAHGFMYKKTEFESMQNQVAAAAENKSVNIPKVVPKKQVHGNVVRKYKKLLIDEKYLAFNPEADCPKESRLRQTYPFVKFIHFTGISLTKLLAVFFVLRNKA